MSFFANLLSKNLAFNEMCSCLDKGIYPINLTGAADIHKAHFISSYIRQSSGASLVVCRSEVLGRAICRDINSFLGEGLAVFYPERDLCFDITQTSSREYEQERLSALCRLKSGEAKLLVAPVSAVMQLAPSKSELESSCFTLRAGDTFSIDEIAKRLVLGGYTRRAQIDGVGQFSIRGGIVDVFCPSSPSPLRIEFWGDDIDSISPFDIDSQRREAPVTSAEITPCREVLFSKDDLITELSKMNSESAKKDLAFIQSGVDFCGDKFLPMSTLASSIFEYIDDAIFVVEPSDTFEAANGFFDRLSLQLSELILSGDVPFSDGFCLTTDELIRYISKSPCILMDTFSRSFPLIQPKKFLNITASQSGLFSGKPSSLPEQLKLQLSGGYTAVICVPTLHLAEIMQRDFRSEGLDLTICSLNDNLDLSLGKAYIVPAIFSACFDYPENRISVISFAGENTSKKAKKKNKAVFDLSSVSVGDYVVHSAHGIGIYKGIQKLEVQGISKDYIKIQYGGSDVLYVPVTQLDMVAKYIGASADDAIKLSRLNSVTWKNTKARVSKAARDMADELISLNAKRMSTKGFAFSEDSDWQRDFESRFAYTETPDQIRCIEEIKKDMESSVPMDRILCGDVGFGKTEVALRAAMKCVMDSKQCAILVPTTILAWQHYKTALSRFDGFPITIEVISGFRSAKEQADILKRLKKGDIDIIIGTHRLIQKDVEFRDLGLAIIDEEQRFGVSHKEKFKQIFAGVDMLTLSATPIPRTLNMAMSGIRDISMIEEAPLDRYPVQTFVLEYNRRLLISAIEKELARGGQVYYLHNRIEDINAKAAAIAQAIPNCRVAVAHGALSSNELEKIWKSLVDHEIDVLVCTTIIETGVDVANCNTMIIEDADRMGLSQLYQLRGRIGRSSRRAYAYFTFRPGRELTDIASKRLSAIRDFTAFGSGFQIALRDLEIRGSGNIIGAQQHGHMDSVGYDMYLKLLNEAIAEGKGEEIRPQDTECLIDLPISSHIPNSYIDDNVQRIEVYRHIALIKNDEDAMDVTDELIDRFGDPPPEVSLLIQVALLRNMAQKAKITTISQKSDFVLIEFEKPDLRLLSLACSEFSRTVFLSNGKVPYLSVKIQNKKDMLLILNDIVSFIAENAAKLEEVK